MVIIQETEDILIYREFCAFTWHDERFLKNKQTGEESMFAEDVARILGFRDIHHMITDPEVQNLIDLTTLEPGIYPITTISIAETRRLFEGIAETPSEKLEFFADNYSEDIAHNAGEDLADDIEYLIEGNRTIMGATALPCNVTQSGDGPVSNWSEFVLELKADASGSIVLLKEDVEIIHRILNRYKPAE